MKRAEITNEKELTENALFADDRRARETALKVLITALNSVEPRTAVRNLVRREGGVLTIGSQSFDLNKFHRIFVVGGGKASGAMAEALEGMIGDRIEEGLVNILRGTKSTIKTEKIILNEAGHPRPDENGVRGAERIFQLVSRATKDDLIICLISGGGSALMPLPSGDISLQDVQDLTDSLLRCGATIGEINAVRKHVSSIKGGQLAKAAFPATIVSLILSDVVGDPLDTIASGPTAPDTTTFSDAISILKRYKLWRDTSDGIKGRLEAGMKRRTPETPKPNDRVFDRTYNIIIGNNRLAALAACREAKKLGFNAMLLSCSIEGEARHVGTVYSGIIKEIHASNYPIPKPAVVVAGGETTVTVTGQGKGGRNQELVLSASLGIEGLRGVAIASIGTDGIDGPTDASGAIADGRTVSRARGKGMSARKYLMDNDSYGFFSELSDVIITGPTGTNVNDLAAMIVV